MVLSKMANNGTCSQRKRRKCKKRRCVCSEDSNTSEESSYSLQSCERKCTCTKKKDLNDIPPELLPMIRSTRNKKSRSKSTSKPKNRITRKPLQERLQEQYPSITNLCNTICLCNKVLKPKYSADTIRKVPPQPNCCCPKERKIVKKSPTNKTGISQPANKPDEFIPIYIADNKKGKGLSNCSTEIEKKSSNQIQRTQLAKENENKNKKLFKSRTIMTDDYATFDCIQIEIESDDDASGCNCRKVEEKNVGSQTKNQQREKQVQTNPTEEKNKTKSPKKANKQTKSPQAEPDKKADPIQDKPTILKRCICFVKKQRHGEKKSQKVLAEEESCECKSNNSHLTIAPRGSECSCENVNETHSASLKAKPSDVEENCCCAQTKHSNTELKPSTSNHRKKVGQNSNNPNSMGPQNIEIHIGKSNARITIIRDLD